MLDTVRQDVRYALRGLHLRPGFAAGVVITLALGIGANAAMFGIVDRMLFRPPPFMKNAGMVHRIYFAFTARGKESIGGGSHQYARYVDLATKTSSFARTAAYNEEDLAVGVGEA